MTSLVLTMPSPHAAGTNAVPSENRDVRVVLAPIRPDSHDLWRQWQSLETRLKSTSVAASCDWNEAWLSQYHEQVSARCVMAYDADELVGIALICESRQHRVGPFQVNSVYLGTAGEAESESVCVEDNAVLVDARYARGFWVRLFEELDREPGWDSFVLSGMNPAAFAAASAAIPQWAIEARVSWYFDLKQCRDQGESIESGLGYSTRKALRRKLRDLGPLKVEWASTADEATSFHGEMVEMHQQRWTAAGKPGCYVSDRFLNTHRELLRRMVPAGRAAIVRVSLEQGGTLGVVQAFVDGNRLLVYQSGWRQDMIRHSPGLVTDYLTMCDALKRGYDAYDFLAGEGRHKERLSTTGRNLYWAEIRRPRWKFALADRWRAIKQFAASARSRWTWKGTAASTLDQSGKNAPDAESESPSPKSD